MIKVKNLEKTVTTHEGELQILQQINLSIDKAESVAIVGSSGSGKSTLLGLLAGLDLPTQGEVFLNDTDMTQLDEDGRAELRAKRVGFVFQSFQLLPSLTALENVMLPLELSQSQGPEDKAKELLTRVGLKHRLHHYPKQLSGGEQQRVAIARAFATEPEVLFADEPTGNLDKRTGLHVIELLFQLNNEHGTTLVLVTHDEKLANRCNRQLILEEGRLINDDGLNARDKPEQHGFNNSELDHNGMTKNV